MSEMINPSNDPQLPAYMQQEETLGTEKLDDYVRPSRLKLVQAMSKEPFDQYPKGTVMLVPQMMVFSEMDTATRKSVPFKFVPLFFYPEWIQTNPLSKSPFVRERSLDPNSELAKKSRDRETWFERHPDDPELEVANREVLNFIIMPYDHPLAGTMCVLSFSKASFRDGTNLAQMIKTRKAPIFGQVFTGMSAERKNDKGQWYGFDLNIADTPWVTQEEYEVFKAVHLELRKSHEDGLLAVDYEDVPSDELSEADSTEY